MATATEPVGGSNGTKRSPQRTMAFTMLTTIFPASSPASSLTVLTAPSQGVETTTRSVWAASRLVPGEIAASMPLQRFVSSATAPAALSSLREPTTTSTPTEAKRAARAEPAGPVPPSTPICMLPSPKVPSTDVPSPDAPSPDATVADTGTVDTLLAFLTTSCASCKPFWEMMATPGLAGALGARLVIVTPSRSMEDERRARELLPDGAYLHMGSETWFEYGIGSSASFVLVRSSQDGPEPWQQAGQVLGSTSGKSPDELLELVKRWQAVGT